MRFFNSVYEGKKVFLTGHTGFKGSWLLSWLKLAGADVMGYALPPKPEHKLFGLIKGETLCHSVLHNILEYSTLEKSILAFQPDFIFHLAAQPIVRYSYDHPLETFNVNIMGTANVLQTMHKLTKPCIAVVVTTDKVYQNAEQATAFTETDRLGGYDPYSASKAAAELVIDSYRNSFFNPATLSLHHKTVVSARAGNVIGGGDWATDRIIPDIIRALKNREHVIIRNPRAVRPWQHVLEPLHAYLLLGQKLVEHPGALQNAYNFGPALSDCLSVEEIVQQAIEVWGTGSYTILKDQSAPHEAGLLMLDISRAKSDLEWRPVYRAKEAIDKTISWYKSSTDQNASHLIQEDIRLFTKNYHRMAEEIKPV